MNNITTQFLNRIFKNNKTIWWANLSSETPKKKYGPDARFLQNTLQNELSDIPGYRRDDRRLFFFSSHDASSIDGRYKSLGVEEKYNPLDIKEHLVDGAIHRGMVWVLGNPQSINRPLEAVSLYVVKRESLPIDAEITDLFFPVLTSAYKLGVHVIFIQETSGKYWHINTDFNNLILPNWLSQKHRPKMWDLDLETISEINCEALRILNNEKKLSKYTQKQCFLPGFGKRGEFTEIAISTSCKAAIMDYGNEWRLIEFSLLLRSYGYHAVKVIYNRNKHKNKINREKHLTMAGRGVENKIAEQMLKRFAIIIDWKL